MKVKSALDAEPPISLDPPFVDDDRRTGGQTTQTDSCSQHNRASRRGGHRKVGLEAHRARNGLPILRSPRRPLFRLADRRSGPGREPSGAVSCPEKQEATRRPAQARGTAPSLRNGAGQRPLPIHEPRRSVAGRLGRDCACSIRADPPFRRWQRPRRPLPDPRPIPAARDLAELCAPRVLSPRREQGRLHRRSSELPH
jgi:hypothetical protein